MTVFAKVQDLVIGFDRLDYAVGDDINMVIKTPAKIKFTDLPFVAINYGVLYEIQEKVNGVWQSLYNPEDADPMQTGAEDRTSFWPFPTLPGQNYFIAVCGTEPRAIAPPGYAYLGCPALPCGKQVAGGREFRMNIYVSEQPPTQDRARYRQL